MKKSLLKLLMSLLMIMTATVTASAQCYILGNDGNWQTNKASAELQKTDIDGVYEGEVTFAPNAKYFGIVTKLTEEPGQWSSLREYRYGPAKANQLLSYDNPQEMVFQKDASFQVPGEGTYRLRVDFNAMTVTMLGTYPSSLYVLGSKGNFEPTGEEPLPMTETKGVYKATIEFTNTKFSIISSENSKQLGGGRVLINRDNDIAYNDSYFSITKPGTYEVTVDLRNMTMKLFNETYVPDYPDYVYFLGTDGNKVANDGVKLEWEDEEGVYTGWVNFESNKFYISSALASTPDGWDEIKDYRIGAPTATCNVEPNLTVGVEKGVDSEFLIEFPAGTSSYYALVTLDLPNKRMTIYDNDPNYPQRYPKELYVIGSTGKWHYNIPANIISATEVPGIYEGEITFKGERSSLYFAILKRLAIDWATVNATRLSPANDGDIANLNEDIIVGDNPGSGAWKFTGKPGTYDIRVDLTQGMGVIRISEKAETGIVAPNIKTPAKSYYYDLNGRFLGNVEPQKGIYVVKGKKVIK